MYQRLVSPVFLIFLILVSAVAVAEVQHPSQYPPLSIDATYPRCSTEDLARVGYPDDLHAHWWPGWQVLVDDEGITYGPGAFCNRKTLLDHDGLETMPGRNSHGHFVTLQNEAYEACDLMKLLECLDWAGHVLPEMLGLEVTDTLTVLSPDKISDYRDITGYKIWRLYKLDGDSCTIQSFGILAARTLETHAVFMLMTDWLLRENLPTDLPPWLHSGLVEYMGQDGAHLANYMREFRHNGDILFSPAISNHILGQGPDADPDRDREMFRRASYSSFLMVWELVENRGGMKALREFLVLASEGVELDRAARKVYGTSMEELAISLDPVILGEPIGNNFISSKPAKQPAATNSGQ